MNQYGAENSQHEERACISLFPGVSVLCMQNVGSEIGDLGASWRHFSPGSGTTRNSNIQRRVKLLNDSELCTEGTIDHLLGSDQNSNDWVRYYCMITSQKLESASNSSITGKNRVPCTLLAHCVPETSMETDNILRSHRQKAT